MQHLCTSKPSHQPLPVGTMKTTEESMQLNPARAASASIPTQNSCSHWEQKCGTLPRGPGQQSSTQMLWWLFLEGNQLAAWLSHRVARLEQGPCGWSSGLKIPCLLSALDVGWALLGSRCRPLRLSLSFMLLPCSHFGCSQKPCWWRPAENSQNPAFNLLQGSSIIPFTPGLILPQSRHCGERPTSSLHVAPAAQGF